MSVRLLIIAVFVIQIIFKLILNDFSYINTLISQMFVVFIPTMIYLIASEKRVGTYLNVDKNRILPDIAITTLTVVAVNILCQYINYPIIKIIGLSTIISPLNNSVYEIIINIIVMCCFPAIFEEILFRGILLDELTKRYSCVKASVITSAIFAILHLDAASFLPQFVLGLFLCYITFSAKSVLLPMVAHFSNNLFSILTGEYITQCILHNRIIAFLLALLITTAGVVYFNFKTLRREI